ncbi:eukaryotic translation initiation factor 3subunit A [Striga asiatica]|uniref:Eukaryotic translation initiation factor 3subunit A n=1 Tax=Striga asiatica TaxID=4170 RepID=A0A5A7P5H3_STRAF|nr:eukaryotic translation initiation factor 3subunit A [Striga asiatica]
MAILFELLSLALKPLVLAKLSCQISAQIMCIIIQTWLDVLRFALSLHLIILTRVAIWALSALTLPARAFTALYRERLLEMQVYRLKNELESVILDRKEAEEKLREAIEELKSMEMLLMELEEEHDEAIMKVEMLQREVHDLKDHTVAENFIKSPSKSDNCEKIAIYRSPIKNGSNIYGAQSQRDVALYRSLFSTVLSLTVGFVMWEGENNSMPLVLALFTVVIISLMSVARLFGVNENKPASDAIALLSLNWFVLGTISCPILPRIARFLAALTLSFV